MSSEIISGPTNVALTPATYGKLIASPDPSRDGVRVLNPSSREMKIAVVEAGDTAPGYATAKPYDIIPPKSHKTISLSGDYDVYAAVDRGTVSATVWEGTGSDFFSGGGGSLNVANLPALMPGEYFDTDRVIVVRGDEAIGLVELRDIGETWTPVDLDTPAFELDPGVFADLFLDTARTTPAVADGTEQAIRGVTAASGSNHFTSTRVRTPVARELTQRSKWRGGHIWPSTRTSLTLIPGSRSERSSALAR